jgi:hypothetical protein
LSADYVPDIPNSTPVILPYQPIDKNEVTINKEITDKIM